MIATLDKWPETYPALKDVDLLGGPYVDCLECGQSKAPLGRSIPATMATALCDSDCTGYRSDPSPEQRWPHEWEPIGMFGGTNKADLRTILATDDPAGVGEMINYGDSVCSGCGATGTVVYRMGEGNICGDGREACGAPYVSTAGLIFLWDGRPVDGWTRIVGGQSCDKCGPFNLYDEVTLEEDENPCSMAHTAHCLTAVVLVGEPKDCDYCQGLGSRRDTGGGVGTPMFCGPCDGSGERSIDFAEAIEACAEAGVQFIIPGDPEKGRLEL